MDFATLKTEVSAWVLDLPASVQARIGTFVNQAVRDATDKYNFRFMESTVVPSPVSTAELTRQLVAKPSDWKESRGLPFLLWQDGGTSEIDWAGSQSNMNRTFSYQEPQEANTTPPDTGRPRYLHERPDTIDVYPLPDLLSGWDNGNYRIVIPYWAHPAPLALDADTNYITETGPQYVIWRAVAYAFMFNRDEERGDYYEAKAERKRGELQRIDKMSKVPDRLVISVHKNVYAGRSRVGSNRG